MEDIAMPPQDKRRRGQHKKDNTYNEDLFKAAMNKTVTVVTHDNPHTEGTLSAVSRYEIQIQAKGSIIIIPKHAITSLSYRG